MLHRAHIGRCNPVTTFHQYSLVSIVLMVQDGILPTVTTPLGRFWCNLMEGASRRLFVRKALIRCMTVVGTGHVTIHSSTKRIRQTNNAAIRYI
jgi:hypothetical protein